MCLSLFYFLLMQLTVHFAGGIVLLQNTSVYIINQYVLHLATILYISIKLNQSNSSFEDKTV